MKTDMKKQEEKYYNRYNDKCNYKYNHKYDDIINMEHHVSQKHPQMSLYARSAQFALFAVISRDEDFR